MQEARAIAISFTKHPSDVGETYGEHFKVAGGFGVAMIVGGMACLVHAVLPFMCTTTGSRTIRGLHDRMVTNRVRSSVPSGVPTPG